MCIKCFVIHRTYKKECLGLKCTCFNRRNNVVFNFTSGNYSEQTLGCFYYMVYYIDFSMKYTCKQYTN